ncbi:MAG: ABC transporter ATP-binding protein [Actinomycetota bacterium]
MTSVDVRSLSVELGGRSILSDVSLSVPSGDWLGLIGPNGAGKTTLLRAIAGLIPAHGDVLLDGAQATSLRARERARLVAIVAQRPSLPDAMNVADYVLLGRSPYIRYFDTETRTDMDAAARALERLDIGSFADRPLGTLSGGEQQRVVLARALAQATPVLLLDEGTAALDVGSQQQVLELVSQLRDEDGTTVVSAMHDLTLAAQYADSVVLVHAGRVIETGPPEVVIREDLIRSAYGAEVRITRDADGIVVAPVRSRRGARSPT